MADQPNIVIVGGGAGGLELATKLGNSLGKKQQAKITLVDRSLTHIWKPLLHEVAAGTIDSHEDEISYAAHAYYHHFHFQLGQLAGLDRSMQVVKVAIDEHQTIDLPYDYLVLAIGSISNNFNIPGTDQHCYYLDSREQADQFHQHFLRLLMKPSTDPIHAIIIGAGATGVELAAELHFSIKNARKYGIHEAADGSKVKLTIVEGADRILPVLPKRISKQVMHQLDDYQVEVITDARVTEVKENEVCLSTGQTLPADIVVWAAGIKSPKILNTLDSLEVNKINQIVINSKLQSTTDQNIYAIGDCAFLLQQDGTPVPARAQAAHQQSSVLVKSFKNKLQNKPDAKFEYYDYGSLISLSEKGTVGQLMSRIANVMVEGYLARMFYVSLYKMHQLSLHGWWRTSIMSLARMLNHRIKPKLKLH